MSSKSKKAFKTLFYFLLLVLIIAGAAEFALYKLLTGFTKVPSMQKEINPGTLLLNANDIPFRSSDGADLHGWLIQGKPGSPALIIAHDYGSSRSAVLGQIEGLISSLNKQGYFIFLFDFRGHGKSESPSAFGYKEHLDLEAALKEVLKYKQIEPRVGVLGIGMGAIAASEACRNVDSVKFVILDSIYEDIPSKYAREIVEDWPFVQYAQPLLPQIIALNLQRIAGVPNTNLNLSELMPQLYPKPVLFVEKIPPNAAARKLYNAAKEPKELIQLGETASGELIGELRTRYIQELESKILQYFPPVIHQPTLEITK